MKVRPSPRSQTEHLRSKCKVQAYNNNTRKSPCGKSRKGIFGAPKRTSGTPVCAEVSYYLKCSARKQSICEANARFKRMICMKFKSPSARLGLLNLVHQKGLEPSRFATPDPKSGASANSAIGAQTGLAPFIRIMRLLRAKSLRLPCSFS